jgi:hypothetical protein
MRNSNPIGSTYWIWDPTLGGRGRGAYALYNASTGGGTSGSDINENIQSGQAFFVQRGGSSIKIRGNL